MPANPAVVIRSRGDLAVEDRPMPVPGSDEALIEIAYGGICGSDLHYWRHGAAGQSILREPMILGHEVSGVVSRAADDGSGPVEGTPVAVHPASPGEVAGVRYPVDRPHLSPGGTYLGSAAHLPHTQGAFSRYVALPSRMLRPIPAGVSLRAAALAEPASVAWHAVRRAGDVAGRRVVVVGAGPIGALVVAAVATAGSAEITAVDIHEVPLRTARAMGAHRTIQPADGTSLDELQADVAIEASGTAAGLASALRATARGGTLVLVGLLPPGEQPVPISLAIARELDLRGSFRFDTEMDEVLAALGRAELPVERLVSHEFAVADAQEAFAIASDSSISGKVLLRW